MSVGLRDVVVLMLAAGAIAAVVRAMTRDTADAKGRRGRLRELAWCTALLVLSAMVASTGYLLFGRSSAWWIVVPIVALLIIVSRPRLAALVVPVGLILYGLFGFAVARDYAFGGLVHYGLPMVAANPGREAYLILPQAYAMLLLGGYLAVRSSHPVLASARLLLGPVARAPLGEQLRTFALLPVITVIAGLLAPRLWLIGGAGLILTVVVVLGVLLIIRRWPRRAAQVATVALLCLGLAGVVIAAGWRSSSQIVVSSALAAKSAYAQPVPTGKPLQSAGNVKVFPSPGRRTITVPQVAGEPVGQAPRDLEAAGFFNVAAINETSNTIPSGVVIRTVPPAGSYWPQEAPVQMLVSAGPPRPVFVGPKVFKAAPPPVSAPPAPAADIADVAYG
jgi:hypothetical protein